MSKVKITLVRGLAGKTQTQRLTVQALGLSRINQEVTHNDSPGLRGQIAKVQHLVRWEASEV
jgi:large subunit ribosomal protein L30